MYAIEFHAKIKNGLIELPTEYRKRLGVKGDDEKVRVIVLADVLGTSSDDVGEIDMIEQLLSNPLQIPSFKPLDRNELHERS